MFTKPDPNRYIITPLGAAIVEAMPDKKRVARIKRRFTRQRECPTSAIFPGVLDVLYFYRCRGITNIVPIPTQVSP